MDRSVKGTPAETAGPQGKASCSRLVCPAGSDCEDSRFSGALK